MFLNFTRHTVQLICVIMLLLIQFDVCTPLMDAISCQMEMVENTQGEEDASEEVYYRTGKGQQLKAKCMMMDVLALVKSTFVPSVSIQGNDPVPKVLGRTIQPHIFYCVYRI